MPRGPTIPRVPRFSPYRGIGRKESKVPYGFPQKKPANWDGSLAEYYIKLALDRLHAVYTYESYFGTPNVLASVQVDFVVDAPAPVAIRVQGEYWHYEAGTEKQADDLFRKIKVEEKGYRVIDIDAEDALTDPMYFTNEALHYRDHSRGSLL